MPYMTEKEEVTNVFIVGDLDVGLKETDWNEDTDKKMFTLITQLTKTRQ